MKKSLASILTIVCFFTLCLVPSLGILVFGESRAAANEVLAPRPKWGMTVLNETASWLGSRFALRQQMVTAWAKLCALFGTSAEEQVILGRGGWLYYAPTLEDFSGPRLTDAELEQIAQRLSSLQQEAQAHGAQFLFTVAPNKNSLYPEHMPAWAENGHEGADLVRLLPYLERYGVNYADLYAPAMPYYRTDSHWTAEGAAMAADRLLGALGRQSGFAAGPFLEDGVHRGDLYEMLYPALKGAEAEIVYADGFTFESLNDPNGGNAITIRTASASGEGRLYCWGDSFGIALYPYLAESFSEAVFSRSTSYLLPEGEYDAVVLELVERNLGQLLPSETD